MEIFKLKPVGSIKRGGLGERLPAYPGPAGMKSSFYVLPRLETFLGALASLYWSVREDGNCNSSWEECVRNVVLGDNGWIAGPFLLLEMEKGGSAVKRLYVDVSEGLLAILSSDNDDKEKVKESLCKYVNSAVRSRNNGNVTLSELVRELIESPSKWNKGEYEKDLIFISKEALSGSKVGISLDYMKKVTGVGNVYGMIYNIPLVWLELPRVKSAELIYIIENPSNNIREVIDSVDNSLIKLGPKESLFRAKVLDRLDDTLIANIINDGNNQCCYLNINNCGGTNNEYYYMITSETPLSEVGSVKNVEGHPLTDPLTVHFATYGKPVRKTPPLPALKPGTVVRTEVDLLGNDRKLRRALKIIFRR